MEYIYIVLLLLCSAFCSGTEIAYTSLNKLKLHKEDEKPTRVQRLVAYIYNHYDNALSTILFVVVLTLLIIVNVRQVRQEQLNEKRARALRKGGN